MLYMCRNYLVSSLTKITDYAIETAMLLKNNGILAMAAVLRFIFRSIILGRKYRDK